jgi:farnesyl-diphosphate farnesyltransferase
MQEYYELLRATSRTFATGIEALPGPLRDAVTLAYLVLRVSDYFEDSPSLDIGAKRSALELWARLVEYSPQRPPPGEVTELVRMVDARDRHLPDQAAALNTASILDGLARIPPTLRDPIRSHTSSTTRGMSRWAERGADFPDEAALDDYMFEVAGRVGLLLTDLFCAYSPAVQRRHSLLLESAVSFGLGLQTVNIIRGLHEDPARGWIYIPQNLLQEVFPAVDRAINLGELDRAQQLRILSFFVSKAAGHIGDALRYCQTLPRAQRGIRIFCIIPALLALRTASASAGNPQTFETPVKVSRGDVRRVVLSARVLFFSNTWLEGERRRAFQLFDREMS